MSTLARWLMRAARSVASGDCDRGVVLGGSGTGEQIVANKVRGIRCVEAADPVTARLGRQHNDANMLSMGARIIGREVALACVEEFITADFEGGRHARRVDKIRALESDELP
jgi:ribose 5-phosphate isomerase B